MLDGNPFLILISLFSEDIIHRIKGDGMDPVGFQVSRIFANARHQKNHYISELNANETNRGQNV